MSLAKAFGNNRNGEVTCEMAEILGGIERGALSKRCRAEYHSLAS